ncbi:MAG: hypothetical protein JNM89_01725 [Hyphomicrobiaceae bacterium]|nr:hypothetical protein [Hyphomicrobiaceae bacterium]
MRDVSPRTRRNPGATAAVVLAVTVAMFSGGCAMNDASEPVQQGGMSCLDDSPACVSQRQAALRHLVTRSDRHWVKERASVDAYASGVRLFAFKNKKKELTCDELQVGRSEADAADRVLRGPDGKRLSPAQVSRGTMFAAEVSKELSREQARRCRRG